MTDKEISSADNNARDEIDLSQLFGHILDGRWWIICITSLFTFAGIAYALLATPIYKIDSVIQIETKQSGLSALTDSDMASMLGSGDASTTTEIQLLQSRMILGKTVDYLNLTVIATPNYLPIVGKGLARREDKLASIDIVDFHALENTAFTLKSEDNLHYTITDADEKTVLTGVIGKESNNDNGIAILVKSMTNAPNDGFTLVRTKRIDAIERLRKNVSISEQGKQTGILSLVYQGEHKERGIEALNSIGHNYLAQNIQRSAAESQNSINFLDKKLPDLKEKLNKSEQKLNSFREANKTVDLNLEAQSALQESVKLEAQLTELQFEENDLSERFTRSHPTYKAVLAKKQNLLKAKARYTEQVKKMPMKQQEIIRLTRDFQVNQEIYVALLNKMQELNIAKASTVGNVRIIDKAQAHTNAVKPKKSLIVVLACLLGGMFSVGLVLLRAALKKGIESADDIAGLGLPVYATVPLSKMQPLINKKLLMKKGKNTAHSVVLAQSNPADLSIESLRGLRTSLHFAMMEAKNNLIMLSGPSPEIGKSFISSNLAAVLAYSDKKVLLVDLDLRRGYLNYTFNIPKRNLGISEVLAKNVKYEDAISQTEIKGLDVVIKGQTPPNPSELLMSARLPEFLAWASENYDYVLLDTPPILAVTDAAIIASHCGTNLMVSRFYLNSAKEISVAYDRFTQNGIEIKGLILNGLERKASSAYSNYGYYQYNYKSHD